MLGGNVKLVSCGSAPISSEVMDFLKIAFGGTVTEGEFTIMAVNTIMLTSLFRVLNCLLVSLIVKC